MKAFLEEISPNPIPSQGQMTYKLSNSSRLIIGREPSQCQIVLDSNYYQCVSRTHLEIRPIIPQTPHAQLAWEIKDLGSANGTYVNRSRLRGNQILRPGDRIRLGKKGPEFMFNIQAGGKPFTPQNQAVPSTVYESSYLAQTKMKSKSVLPPIKHDSTKYSSTKYNSTKYNSPPPSPPPQGNSNSDSWWKIILGIVFGIFVLYLITNQSPPPQQSQNPPSNPQQPSSPGSPTINKQVLENYFDIDFSNSKKEETEITDIGKVELVKVPVTAKTDIEVPLGSVGCRYYDSQGNQLHNPLPILFDPEQFTSGQQGIMILPIPLSIKSQLTNVEILVAI